MSDRMGSPPTMEDQARLLDDALLVVRQQAHMMRKCLETPGKLMDALKCRSAPPVLHGFATRIMHRADRNDIAVPPL